MLINCAFDLAKIYDFTITIINSRTKDEILSLSFNKVQGSDFNSNKESGNQALRKITEYVKNDFLPKSLEILLSL